MVPAFRNKWEVDINLLAAEDVVGFVAGVSDRP